MGIRASTEAAQANIILTKAYMVSIFSLKPIQKEITCGGRLPTKVTEPPTNPYTKKWPKSGCSDYFVQTHATDCLLCDVYIMFRPIKQP